MKGSEIKLIAYMDGAKKRFVIPVYQRNYDWKIENCKQLFDDLIKVVRNKRKSHFFGSIVSVHSDEARYDEYLVIDGQQRLTTVSLLLLAMYNLLQKGVIESDDKSLGEMIYETYLVDKWQKTESRIKLKPVKNDCVAFGKLFDDETEHVKDSNLTINYRYFYNRIQKEEIPIDDLFYSLSCLEIISITLNPDDNPQLIFESLNSTGLALSEGDKIRNFILMGLTSSKEQNELYEKYWNKIEVCTGYEVSAFVRDYLSVKQQMIPSMNRIYYAFKAYVEESEVATEPLLSDLLLYAKRYEILLNGKTINRSLSGCIYRLNRLETTVARPFFLEVLRLWDEGKIAIDEVADVFLMIENYLFRRTICEIPTNALNKIFLMLHKDVMRYDGTDENYVSKLKYALLVKKERARFPDDAEFTEAFSTRPVYLMTSKNKIYLLERLENFGTLEDKDVYRHFDDGAYSIEHIMPQHLTAAWIRDIGEDDCFTIHETWLHRIANLTLTAYNSKYSNNTFEEKKKMKNGFIESGIRMNQWIAQKDVWTLSELEERSEYLSKRALEIWSMPYTEYKPIEKQMDSYSLDEDADLSGRIIARFSYKNVEQPVISWIDMFERVLKILHSEDKSVLTKLASAPNDGDLLSYVISDDSKSLRGVCEIDDGLYCERNSSTTMKISILRRLFKLFGEEPSELVFYLRDEDESSAEEDITGTRCDVRRKYWTFALDYIHKAHQEKGSFSNVHASKQNWISGFFGVSGFNICCVANGDSARVEIYMGNARKEYNKAAYDKLMSFKETIENDMGVSLIWKRGDDVKSSKVYHEIRNVSIENETDWIQMAKFHAEWSKKFYDVIVPYLLTSSVSNPSANSSNP